MKAARMHAYGDPDVLVVEDAPDPTAGPHDVLIEVHAAAVNPVDWKIRKGAQRAIVRKKLPAILGMDASGVVVAIGDKVTKFAVGDEVFTSPTHKRPGTYAELVAVHEREVARKPAGMSHTDAAAIPLAALTAWDCLVTTGRVAAGDKVFVQAGAGGVGTFAIQLAKHFGATVATTCSARNLDLVRSLGADVAIDYTSARYEDEVVDYDLAIDALGGADRARTLTCVRRGGRIASIVSDLPQHAARYGPTLGVLVAAAKLLGFKARSRITRGVATTMVVRDPSGDKLTEIARVAEAGALRPIIDRVMPLADIAEAHRYSQTGRARGKIVIALRA